MAARTVRDSPDPAAYGPGTPGRRTRNALAGRSAAPRRPRRPSRPKGSPSQAAGRAVSAIRRATGADPGTRTTGVVRDRAGGPVIRQRDSALPDPPPSAKGPIAAIETDNIGAFARDLRVLRSKAGLDYPDMAEKSHYTMRTLASAAGGLRLPTLPVLIAYVNACGGDVAEWEERWGKLVKSGKKGQTALPPPARARRRRARRRRGRPARPPRRALASRPGRRTRQTGEIYVITSAKHRDEHW